MSRPRSPSLLHALELVAKGVLPSVAAKRFGVLPSTLSRAIKPPAKATCPTCGKTLRGAKPQP